MEQDKNLGPEPKRLALFCDGTWNEPGDSTNVWRLRLMLDEKDADGRRQLSYYDEGVGTRWYERLTGGAFGAGLSENVRKGYRWLMEHYNPRDEIYLFGFSRGAFTARSLAGLIARCGLLKPEAPLSFTQLYERYQKGVEVPAIYDLKYFHKTPANLEEEVLLHSTHYHKHLIKMVGVWDTVGSLGLPLGNIPGVSRGALRFHNTNLTTTVEHSYQALALNEYRQPYWAVLWTHFVPEGTDPVRLDNDKRTVEQRWFVGAHANVGGGYRSDLLPQRPLAWMQEKARGCGLKFRASAQVNDADYGLSPRDSYSEFLAGLWKGIRFGQRYVRWVLSEPVLRPEGQFRGRPRKAGWVETVNERIDLSVFERMRRQPGYRSRSLEEWTARRGLDLSAVVNEPEKFRPLWEPVTGPGIETRIPAGKPGDVKGFKS